MSDLTALDQEADYYDQPALLERLTNGIVSAHRQVVFLVGSALTAPIEPTGRGVPGVEGIIDLISTEFSEAQRTEFHQALAGSANRYQEAFRFLLGRRGPDIANQIIRRAVASARTDAASRGAGYMLDAATSEEICRSFEADNAGRCLTPGVQALGSLAVAHPKRFGETILTTNFDPYPCRDFYRWRRDVPIDHASRW